MDPQLRSRFNAEFTMGDVGICVAGGRLVRCLIELQAFPSLFGFQFLLLGCMRKAFSAIPHNWTSTFGELHARDYIELLRRTIVDDANPENVALLEIEPEQQKTRIDFACSESLWRTPIVS